MDCDGQAVVVGADPQPSGVIYVEAVDVPDRIVIINPGELSAIVPVESGIGSDPEDAVIVLDDVVCLSAGKPVGTAVYGLNITAVIGGIRFALGRHEANEEPG